MKQLLIFAGPHHCTKVAKRIHRLPPENPHTEWRQQYHCRPKELHNGHQPSQTPQTNRNTATYHRTHGDDRLPDTDERQTLHPITKRTLRPPICNDLATPSTRSTQSIPPQQTLPTTRTTIVAVLDHRSNKAEPKCRDRNRIHRHHSANKTRCNATRLAPHQTDTENVRETAGIRNYAQHDTANDRRPNQSESDLAVRWPRRFPH